MTNPPATADYEAFEVSRTVRIRASLPTVWQTLTVPEHIGSWFGQTAEFPDGVHVGALGTFGWAEEPAVFPVRIEQYDPMTGFAFTWGAPGEEIRPDNSTTAHFTLTNLGDAVELTVLETGFDTLGDAANRRAALEDNTEGWTSELDEFVAYAEDLPSHPSPGAARADLDAGTVIRTVLVEAPRSTVWRVLTDPDHIERWWGHRMRFPDGIRPGSVGTVEWGEGYGTLPARIEVVRPEIRFDFTGSGTEELDDETATTVRFDLLDDHESGGTLVTVTESGFDAQSDIAARREAMEGNVGGWNTVLDALADYARADDAPGAAE